MRQRFGYLHVPKTAGSSVTNALAAVADDRSVSPAAMDRTLFGAFDRFDEFAPGVRDLVHTGDPSTLERYDAIIGHFSLPTFDAAGLDRADVAMLLREPRARLLSLYTFWRGWAPNRHETWSPYEASARAATSAWPEFLDDPTIASQIDNVALRLLIGTHPVIPPVGFIADDDIDALVAAGLERLESLGHVDVIDAGPGVWERLGRWLGADLTVDRRNTTDDQSGLGTDWSAAFTEAAAASLDRRTRGDGELWERAAQRHATDGIGSRSFAGAAWARQVAGAAERGARTSALEPSRYVVTGGNPTLTWDDVATMDEIRLNLGGRMNSEPMPGYEGFVAVDLFPDDVGWNVSHDLRTPLPLADGSVARIHTEDFLEHIRPAEIIGLLRECRRVLQPGGVLRIACPDYENPKDRLAFDHSPHDLNNPEHITRTDRATIEAWLVEVGFYDYEFLQFWDGDRFRHGPVDYSTGMVRRTPDNDPRCRRDGRRARLRGLLADAKYVATHVGRFSLGEFRSRPGKRWHVTSVICDVTR